MFPSVFQSTLNTCTSFLCALIPLPFACLQCPNPATPVSNNYCAKFTPTLSQLLRLIIGHLRSDTEPVASSRLPLRLKNDFKSLSPPLRTFFKTLMSADTDGQSVRTQQMRALKANPRSIKSGGSFTHQLLISTLYLYDQFSIVHAIHRFMLMPQNKPTLKASHWF